VGRAKSVVRADDASELKMFSLVLIAKNGDEKTIQAPADYVLCALGRSPSTALETLNLRSAGVRLHAVTGHLILDSHLKTTASNIFAAGDCAGGEQFTHLAGYQGSIAAWNATMPWLAWQKAPSETEIPRCTFTDPEAAFIGLSLLENARRIYSDALETRLPLSQFDRAVCEGRSDGFVCIIHRGTAGVILGASAVGMNAGELISEMALAIKKKLTVADVATTMHPYPTLSFGLQVLAANQLAASLKDLVNSSFFSCFRICFCGPKLQGNSSSVPVSQNDSKVGLSAASSSFSL
jgi:pyruvate/2-oxoglutarate dehydrogenase complex dihydrolipoamide dehydrogenase (E3) component